MADKWTKYKLSELGFLGRGKSKHRPRNDISLFGGSYPFIQTGEIKAANLYISNYEQTYNEKGLAQSKLWNEGTLCITIAANIAETAILKIKACFPDSIVGFVADNKLCNVYFIKYYIDFIKNKMQSVSGGACQDNLSLDKIAYFDIEAPKKKIQDKIAKILSNYDDLIENNNMRIKILEEMAQKIYKEWFVDFKFPGHETATFKDSELGKIPSNWEIKEVSDISKLYKGKSYKSSELCNKGEGLPFLNLKCIERNGGFKRDGLKYFNGKYNNNHIVYPEDIIMAVTDMTQERRLVARPARIPHNWYKKYVMSMDLVKLIPSDNMERSYLYSLLKYSNFSDEVKNHANGANVLHLNPKNIEQFELVVADKNTRDKFGEIVNQIYSEIDVLYLKNENLKQTRDILLPRLIAGEIDVEKMEVL